MEFISKTELKLKDFDKCSVICHNDCSLGSLYDYACTLKSYVMDRMKAEEEAKKEKEEIKVEA